MNEKLKKIIKVAVEWLIYILIFVIIVWGTPKSLVKLLHTEYPIASITSSSMWPVLKEGDIVFIKGVNGKNDIKVGDIVVYRNDPAVSEGRTGFTIHRIIEMDTDKLITQGDANNISDPPVRYDQLVGKAITFKGQPLRIPYLGQLSQIFRK